MQTPVIASQAHASVVSGGSANLTIAVPSGTVDGDLLLALLVVSSNVTVTPPAGWNVALSQSLGTATYWRLASSEPADYTFQRASTTNNFGGTIARVTGANQASPLEGTGTITHGSASTLVLSSQTAVDARALIQLGIGFGAVTATPPGTTTERYDTQNGNSHTFYGGDEQISAGATGTRTWTLSGSTGRAGAMFRLLPAPSPTGETYDEAVLADSPLVYYKLSEPSGTTMVDSSGNGRDGTYPTPPTLAQASLLYDDPDTAADFDGTDHGEVASASWMDVATAFTVEGWLKADQVTTQVHIGRRDTGAGATRDWMFRTVSLGSGRASLNGGVWNSAGTLVNANGAAPGYIIGAKVHAAMTYDGANIKLYLGGVLVATAAQTGAPRTQAAPMQVSGSATPFDGILQKFAFYDTALSAARIEAHAAAGYYTGNVAPATNEGAGSGVSTASATPDQTVNATGNAGGFASAVAVAALTVMGAGVAGGVSHANATATTSDIISAAGAGSAVSSGAGTADITVMGVGEAGGVSDGAGAGGGTVAGVGAGYGVSYGEAFADIISPWLTDRTNSTNGMVLTGFADCPWEPSVVDPGVGIIGPVPHPGYETARAHGIPVLSANLPPVVSTTTAETIRHIDRIIVGGKDITYWRGVHTPTPDYDLIDPLLYGAGVLQLPQVHALYELKECRPGGTLPFLAKGKRVTVQRVDAETGEVISRDDYRGRIADYDVDGNSLTLILGGEISGPMSTYWHPTPAFKARRDVGRLVHDSVHRFASFAPRLGPVTGIRLNTFGGMWEIDYLSELLAKAVRVNGTQYTVTRNAAGKWVFQAKDRETIDATIYFDDSAMKESLKQSLSEEPNRVYVTAVAKDGRRINFRIYPGLKQGPPPPYPLASEDPFGVGTTNEDMDNPDDKPIYTMIHRLIVVGYLTREEGSDYLYDAETVRAIKRLQDDAGLAETGIMNVATWKKLYDLDATGYTLAGTMTLPAAQTSASRMWDRTASGALVRRNPNYDPHLQKVDLPISMGAVDSRQDAREFAKTKVSHGGDWVGTVECHLALIRGEHNPGDPVDPADIMPARELRPNMNVWAPLWGGTEESPGTLFHVAGINVRDRGRIVTPALDTRARPSMEAWEVIQRNADTRTRLNRLWIQQHRGIMVDKDGGEWDDVAGLIDDRIRLRGGHWTWFPVIGGQEGIVRSLRTNVDPGVRYAMAIFGRRIGADDGTTLWLDRKVPEPLTETGTERWDKPAIRRALDARILLYTAGQFEQALGYFPGRQTNERTGEATGDPLNGRWEDDAGFSYHTFREPVLYVAMWVAEDTTLRAGRIMWDQFEQGA